MDSVQEIIAKMDTRQERMEASMNAWQKETLACQEAVEACQEKVRPTKRR
jgi:exonuclease VII small subunit